MPNTNAASSDGRDGRASLNGRDGLAAGPARDDANAVATPEQLRLALKETLRTKYAGSMPDLMQEWEDAVRLSEDPKAYKDFVTLLMDFLEIKPRTDEKSHLPMLQINILAPDGSSVVSAMASPVTEPDAPSLEVDHA